MTVYRLYKNRAFEPEAITVMTNAYAEVCHTLGLDERENADTSKVAKTVIEYAQRGVRDPARLRDRVLAAMKRSDSVNAL
jgi:hypothetical protein